MNVMFALWKELWWIGLILIVWHGFVGIVYWLYVLGAYLILCFIYQAFFSSVDK